MSDAASARARLRDARRIVVKVGSRSLVGASLHEGAREGGGRFAPLAAQVVEARGQGRAVVLVSSGAVALGRGRLGFSARPRSIAQLQACAAVGQSLLMHGWERAFGAAGTAVAQMLLSHADLEDRARYLNARAALDALLELGAVPVINENDTVAVDEIRFGDNDQLAAMVCTLAEADLLVLLTDVEGLLDASGARVPWLEDLEQARALVAAPRGDVGSGGMGSKLEAARRAARRGVPVAIADARDPEVLSRVLGGQDVGTLVAPQGARLASRKHWIAFTLRPRGDLLLDAGAVAAIREGGRSLLPAGIIGVRGHFDPGDPVVLRDPSGAEVGRGLTRYGTEDVAKVAGAKTGEIQARLGYHGGDEVVHRDDLVLV
ncbi:MAG TPA: glutamate 5-kinase [Sandaracinaceae bacterium LLY-WYZ-13_1]|nr:glutamate 5-kinase [Sandaracinaceae bacterium LLY-WYZ-13_1]